MGGKRSIIDRAERVEVASRADWRAWLETNHRRTDGVWLVSHKKHHPLYLAWEDIVREALCFGWIDGQAKRLDADRTMRYVSPRKPGSPWSALNKRHIAELEECGAMRPAGREKIEAAKQDGSWTLLDDVEALIVPDDMAEALASTPGARPNYDAFVPSAKRGLLWWVKSARTPATRAARIARVAACAAQGRIATS